MTASCSANSRLKNSSRSMLRLALFPHRLPRPEPWDRSRAMVPASLVRRRALILDRDGVVNEDSGYLHRIEDCRFVEGIFALTQAFARRQFAVVVITNQSGIGRRLYTETD